MSLDDDEDNDVYDESDNDVERDEKDSCDMSAEEEIKQGLLKTIQGNDIVKMSDTTTQTQEIETRKGTSQSSQVCNVDMLSFTSQDICLFR